MHTLLLRLVAPLQAWGIDSAFDVRRTERAPTKSATIGLLGAALGWTRDLSELHQGLSSKLRFGVRVDKEGALLRDYHIAKGEKHSWVTHRHYLADAKFLVGLEGDKSLLSDLDKALKNPYFQIYLGRRSCPPEGRISLGIRINMSLEDALQEEPLLHEFSLNWRPESLRLLVEPPLGESGHYFQKDEVASFAKERRDHVYRSVREKRVQARHQDDEMNFERKTEHDPFKALAMEVD